MTFCDNKNYNFFNFLLSIMVNVMIDCSNIIFRRTIYVILKDVYYSHSRVCYYAVMIRRWKINGRTLYYDICMCISTTIPNALSHPNDGHMSIYNLSRDIV